MSRLKMDLALQLTVLCLLSLVGSRAIADIELPEEELAKESVLPRFENSMNVKNKNIVLSNKFEMGVYFGANFSEPIESQYKLGLNLGYHFDEVNAIDINYAMWMSGLNTQYTSPLSGSPYNLDFNRAPQIQNSGWINYEPTLYYGKISLTKRGVANLSMYPILGLGETTYTNKMYYGLNVGVGWKFYFAKSFALRVDLKEQYSGKPNPFNGADSTLQPKPNSSAYGDVTVLGTILDIGLVALF